MNMFDFEQYQQMRTNYRISLNKRLQKSTANFTSARSKICSAMHYTHDHFKPDAWTRETQTSLATGVGLSHNQKYACSSLLKRVMSPQTPMLSATQVHNPADVDVDVVPLKSIKQLDPWHRKAEAQRLEIEELERQIKELTEEKPVPETLSLQN